MRRTKAVIAAAERCAIILAQIKQETSDTTWRAALGQGIHEIEKEFKIGRFAQVTKPRTKKSS